MLSLFCVGATGAWVVYAHANKLGLIDNPNKSSSHSIPTPKGGGVGILIGVILLALIFNINIYNNKNNSL